MKIDDNFRIILSQKEPVSSDVTSKVNKEHSKIQDLSRTSIMLWIWEWTYHTKFAK